jgi:hypothetical protein
MQLFRIVEVHIDRLYGRNASAIAIPREKVAKVQRPNRLLVFRQR